jgi:acetylornithine deacetylase/succinyl-diaminopimelate desuccinylase-like protein
MLINLEELSRIHGVDERVSEENMIKGTQVFTDIVKRLCNLK